jgi:hypothetical protein
MPPGAKERTKISLGIKNGKLHGERKETKL